MTRFGKTCVVTAVVLAGLAVTTPAVAQQSQEKTSESKVHIGTYDSRALALAYFRSEAFKRQITEMKAEYEKAKEAGEMERAQELEIQGSALQELMHKQGFSTWPVDNILDKIKGEIPEIAKQANVDVIISRWSITYQRLGVEFTDVTDLMVKSLNPDADTQKMIKEIQKLDPVPLEELKNHED